MTPFSLCIFDCGRKRERGGRERGKEREREKDKGEIEREKKREQERKRERERESEERRTTTHVWLPFRQRIFSAYVIDDGKKLPLLLHDIRLLRRAWGRE
jgi:hypothetical protein